MSNVRVFEQTERTSRERRNGYGEARKLASMKASREKSDVHFVSSGDVERGRHRSG